MNEYRTVGSRKARVGRNIACMLTGPMNSNNEKAWAVFKHTLYLRRWYYDGYDSYATREEAEEAMNDWLYELREPSMGG